VLDGSKLQLEDGRSYENMFNELISKLGEDVATPDLTSAVKRFNEFNQKLVNNLPIGYQPES
jgi:GTP cyclohydrolase I